ncbi:receptor-type tyrosine-protein phosphatase beta-like [Lampetra fluviatilis]
MRSRTDTTKMGSAWPALVKYLILMAVLLIQGGFGQTTANPTVIPTTATTTPEPPLDVHVTVIETTVELTWRDGAACIEGRYNVIYATNSSGAASGSRGGNVSSTCSTPSDPYLANLTNLVPGAGYTVTIWLQTVVRWNNNTQTMPAPVSNVILDNNGSTNSLHLSFQSAIGDVDSYAVDLVDGQSGSVVQAYILQNSTTEQTFTDLTAGRLYRAKVTTVSGDLNSTGVEEEMCTVPHTVQNLTLENKGTTNNLTVNFTSAAGDVTHYVVELEDTTNGSVVKPENLSNDTTVYIFNGLTAGRRYRVNVTTESGNCTSPPVTAEMCTVPQTVQSITLDNNGTTNNLTVNFLSATEDVTHYTVQLVDTTNESVVKSENLSSDATVSIFNGLTAGRLYRVIVTTVSGDCVSPSVTAEMCTVPETVQSVTLENFGTTNNLTVNFTKAIEDVTHYTVELEDTTNGSVIMSDLPNDTTVSIFDGLTPGRRYKVHVTTMSGNCASLPVTAEMCTVPEIVQNVTLENKDTTTNLTVNFTGAAGDVTHYTVELVDTTNESVVRSGKLSNGTTEDTFNDLVPGRHYQVHVTTVSGDCNSTEVAAEMRTFPAAVENLTLENKGTTNSLTVNFTKAKGDVTNYTVELMDTTNESVVRSENLSNGTTNHLFTDLDACKIYEVHIKTLSGELYSKEVTETACTDPAAVEDLIFENRDTTDSLTVTFSQTTCKTASYTVELKELKNDLIVGNVSLMANETSHTFSELEPGRLYQVIVTTIGGDCKGIQAKKDMCTNPNLVRNLNLTTDLNKSLSVGFDKASGNVDNYTVLLTNGDTSLDLIEHLNPDKTECSFEKLQPCTKYHVSVTTSSSFCKNTLEPRAQVTYPNQVRNVTTKVNNYNRININWVKPEGNVETFNVVLSRGSSVQWERSFNSSESFHATGALAYSTTYNVLVEACCQNLCFPDVGQYEKTCPNVILIACLTTAMIVVIAGAVSGFLFYRRRKRVPDEVPSNNPTSMRKRSPVPFSKFPEYYKKREADSGYLFSEEYQELSSVGKSQAMEAATLAENRTKNRYTNILPFDVTRVKLASVEDIPHSDYINANYIKGHSSSREYIAAQGPLAGTREDFWRMVWEQKVNQIVMLTNCVERGQPKCECYWPMDITPVRYGDIGLVMEWDKPSPEWTIRHLLVKNHKTDEMRPLYHFHFTAWPDHGVPDTTDSLTNFVRIFRTHVNTTNKGGPIVVHCSAGVGRTGTFISLDHLLQDIDKKPEIDIYGIVHDMRMSRVLMVQTEMQYIFIHKCILKVLEEDKKKDSDYEVIYSNEGIYENNIVDNFHMEPRNQNNNENHTFLTDN